MYNNTPTFFKKNDDKWVLFFKGLKLLNEMFKFGKNMYMYPFLISKWYVLKLLLFYQFINACKMRLI